MYQHASSIALYGRPALPLLLWLLAAALLYFTGNATAAPNSGGKSGPLAELQQQATFCEGTYALCIKAHCEPIPTLDRLGNYAASHALCSCEVVKGWSMGPGACEDRKPVTQNNRTYLISTYSNRYNERDQTLFCESQDTQWAWCYGAPCVVDERDPNRAHCTCPVQTGPAKTLGGDCKTQACSGIWSAATPGGDVFANEHFYKSMQKAHPNWPTHPAAAACPTTGTSSGTKR